MSLSKKKEIKEFGIGTREAVPLLCDIVAQEEGINKKDGKALFVFLAANLMPSRKRTIHDRSTFENKAKMIINEYREKINNGNYQEASKEIFDLFRAEIKSDARLYLEDNSTIILMALTLISVMLSALALII